MWCQEISLRAPPPPVASLLCDYGQGTCPAWACFSILKSQKAPIVKKKKKKEKKRKARKCGHSFVLLHAFLLPKRSDPQLPCPLHHQQVRDGVENSGIWTQAGEAWVSRTQGWPEAASWPFPDFPVCRCPHRSLFLDRSFSTFIQLVGGTEAFFILGPLSQGKRAELERV